MPGTYGFWGSKPSQYAGGGCGLQLVAERPSRAPATPFWSISLSAAPSSVHFWFDLVHGKRAGTRISSPLGAVPGIRYSHHRLHDARNRIETFPGGRGGGRSVWLLHWSAHLPRAFSLLPRTSRSENPVIEGVRRCLSIWSTNGGPLEDSDRPDEQSLFAEVSYWAHPCINFWLIVDPRDCSFQKISGSVTGLRHVCLRNSAG